MPFPAILANCVGWIAYAYVVRDWYVWVPNEIGFLLGSFYTLSCFGLLDTKVRTWAGAVTVHLLHRNVDHYRHELHVKLARLRDFFPLDFPCRVQ